VYDRADIQKLTCTLTTCASYNVGQAFQLTHSCTIKNNGPVAATVTDTATLGALPSDCTTSSAVTQSATFTLASGAQTTSSFMWAITCTQPSTHNFTASNVVTIDPVASLHVRDPNPNNNTGSSSTSVAILSVRNPGVTAGPLN